MGGTGDDDGLDTRWRHLRDRLATIKEALNAPQADRLLLCGEAQRAVISFLDDDQSVLEAGLARPFKITLAELHDMEQGAQPVFLKPRKKTGRPTNLTSQKLRGTTLGVLKQITLCGKQEADAAQLIANRLRKLGVRDDNGNPIRSNELLHQLRRIDKQPQDTQAAYDAICRAIPALTDRGSDEETVERLLNMLGTIRNWS
jgi:hypothetical protein